VDTVTWRKSSYSTAQGECVEVAIAGTVGVRDTKNRASGQLTVSREAWSALVMHQAREQRG
jgi:hypothetical protein